MFGSRKRSRWLLCIFAMVAIVLLAACGREPNPGDLAEDQTFNPQLPAIPMVKINDTIYTYVGATSWISEDYQQIGEVTGIMTSVSAMENGEASGLSVGDPIYQCPGRPDEVLAYTTLFSGSEDSRHYVRFHCKCTSENYNI